MVSLGAYQLLQLQKLGLRKNDEENKRTDGLASNYLGKHDKIAAGNCTPILGLAWR